MDELHFRLQLNKCISNRWWPISKDSIDSHLLILEPYRSHCLLKSKARVVCDQASVSFRSFFGDKLLCQWGRALQFQIQPGLLHIYQWSICDFSGQQVPQELWLSYPHLLWLVCEWWQSDQGLVRIAIPADNRALQSKSSDQQVGRGRLQRHAEVSRI